MELLILMIKAIMGLILMVAYLVVAIGSLWVLRIAINWYWDFDYVEWIKKHGLR